MTALRKYQRLECGGLWRETPQDQRREVLVRFGEATLVLTVTASDGTRLWTNAAWDRLLPDDCTLPLGSTQIHVLPTPGHTNDSVSFLIGDAVFIGDTLFMPDAGSARCDFPGGNAAELYRSVQRLFT